MLSVEAFACNTAHNGNRPSADQVKRTAPEVSLGSG